MTCSPLAVAAVALGGVGFAFLGFVPLIIALAVTLGLSVAAIAVLVSVSKLKKKVLSELEVTADSYNATPDSLGDRIDEALTELARM